MDFREGNEWIASLSNLCVVIEGHTRSGALMAPRHALRQGKTVYVRTTSGTPSNMEGCRRLLQEGAKPLSNLVTRLTVGLSAASALADLDSVERSLLSKLSTGAFAPQELTNDLNLNYTMVVRALARLEVLGWLQRERCGRWYRTGLPTDDRELWWRSTPTVKDTR